MAADPAAENLVLTVISVFSITGRGTAVIGPLESGVIKIGDQVDIWDGDRL